jgi:hypothetical protein
MPYDPITQQWRDDATGVPDAGMPPGMGDPTGGIVPPAQQTPMVPQQITPRPILGGPQPAPAFTPSAVDATGNPLKAPPIPLPVTDPRVGRQIQQGFQQLDRPSMGPGDLAATILKSPVTVPLGIIEEIKGLFGGNTVQGWAQDARSRYNDPNFTESRAFGVQGPAEEPAFGDRFTGVVTGSAQRGAMAGKIIRQQIGAYNAQRKAALHENKDVQQLQLGDINLQKGTFDVQHQGEDFATKMDARKAATRASGAATAASELAAQLSRFNLQDKLARKARADFLFSAIRQDPELAKDTKRLMELAGGDLDLVVKAQNAYTGAHTLPDDTGMTGAQKVPLVAGLIKDLGAGVTSDIQAENRAIGGAGAVAQDQARADVISQQDQIRADAIRNQETTAKALAQARKDIDAAYANRELQMPSSGGFLGMGGASDKDKLAFLANLGQEKSRVLDLLNRGALNSTTAGAIANRPALEDPASIDSTVNSLMTSGELDPALFNAAVGGGKYLTGDADYPPPPIPTPTPLATPAPPIPTRAVPTPRPAGDLPSSQGNAALQELVDRLIGKPRPTPMATPSPTPSRAGAGTMSEDARRANADRLARFTPQFQAKWQAQHPDKPMRGPLYESEFKRNATANGIVVESLQ